MKGIELTERERRVAAAIFDEKSDKEIASDMNVNTTTVKYVVRALFDKLGVRTRVGIALFVARSVEVSGDRYLATGEEPNANVEREA